MTIKRKISRKKLKGGRHNRSSRSSGSSGSSRSSGSSGSSRNSSSRTQRRDLPQRHDSDPHVNMAIQAAINDAAREAIEEANRDEARITTPAENLTRLSEIYTELLAQDNDRVGADIMQDACRNKRSEVLRLKNNIRTNGTLLQKRLLSNILSELKDLCPPDTIVRTVNRERNETF